MERLQRFRERAAEVPAEGSFERLDRESVERPDRWSLEREWLEREWFDEDSHEMREQSSPSDPSKSVHLNQSPAKAPQGRRRVFPSVHI